MVHQENYLELIIENQISLFLVYNYYYYYLTQGVFCLFSLVCWMPSRQGSSILHVIILTNILTGQAIRHRLHIFYDLAN